MSWLRVSQGVANHFKVIKVARLTGNHRFSIVGFLVAFWSWALDNASDGVIPAEDMPAIVSQIGWPGEPAEMIQALLTCGRNGGNGLLEKDGDLLRIHDWNEYAGVLLDRRERDRKRKALERTSPACPKDIQRTSKGHPKDIRALRYVNDTTTTTNCLTASASRDAATPGSDPATPGFATQPASKNNPPVMEFPCNGNPKTWLLTVSKLREYRASFPDLDVDTEFRKAKQWLLDNHLKTARGMPRFLGGWLGRANDRGSMPPRHASGAVRNETGVTPIDPETGTRYKGVVEHPTLEGDRW